MDTNHSEGFSFLTTDMLKNPNKRPAYTKREILQKEYPDFWGGANELVRILRELQNLLVELLPKYKQVLPKTFEKLEDKNYQNICLNYIKYRILYAFAEEVWKETEQQCSNIAMHPNANNSAKDALIHSFEVFNNYSLIDIVDDEEKGFDLMREMINTYEPHIDFNVLCGWRYSDIIGIIQSKGLSDKQLWQDMLEDPDPKEASIGELLDDDKMIRIY